MNGNWFTSPAILEGTRIDLVSLQQEHFDQLRLLAEDKRIWQFYIMDGSDPGKLTQSLEAALTEREKGTQFPFVIIDRKSKELIGSTRFLDIQPQHRKLEIGWTWLHPDHWATSINTECKLLLLTYCFEVLQTIRVQFKTDENNIRSRKAIEKIGGHFEGIHRNDMMRDNGTIRNSAYFSIIDQEWPALKTRLSGMIY